MNSMMVTYVIALYIRLSIEDSKVDSLSIENQKNALHKYVDTMEGVRNVEVLEFIDNGYSGTNFERPAIQELLELVRAGKINCIIVKDFSRFGRNSIEVGYFMERVFPLYGIRFLSLNDDFDSDRFHGDTGGINVAFKYLVSEFYSRDLSVKSKTAKYVKMKRGEYQSVICPYGYKKGADGKMEPDEETAPNVRFIFEMARDGHTAQQIVEALFEKKIPTPGEHKAAKGKRYHDVSRCYGVWQRPTVLRIINDERYTGTYIMGKRKVTEVGSTHTRLKDESEWFKVPDHHPAIVSRELFAQAHSKLRHFKSVKRNVNLYPLRGKVFCGCCRHAMPRTAAKNHMFICRYTKVDESFPCNGLNIQEVELESILYEVIYKQAQVILNLENLSNAGVLDMQLAKQNDYDRQIQDLQDKKRVLYEQLLLQEISMEEYKSQKAAIDVELNRIKRLHAVLAAQTTQMRMDSEAKSARKKLAQDITGAGGLTSGLVDTLIDRVYIYPGNQVEIIWKIKDFCTEEV